MANYEWDEMSYEEKMAVVEKTVTKRYISASRIDMQNMLEFIWDNYQAEKKFIELYEDEITGGKPNEK